MGIIAGAMSGAGAGIMDSGKQLGAYAEKSALQDEMAKITAQRDQVLNEFAKESQARDFQFKTGERREGEQFTAGENTKQRTSTEGIHASDRASVEREGEANRGVQREQLAQQGKYQNAMVSISAAAEGRLATGAKLDNAIKQFAVDNTKRVEELRKEFASAPPERQQAITTEIQLLTGKDNDKYLPVPIGFDEATGKPNAYRIFDTKSGNWKDGGEAPKIGAKWDNSTGDVIIDGKKIGTAKTEAEARKLVASARNSSPAGTTASTPPNEPGTVTKGAALRNAIGNSLPNPNALISGVMSGDRPPEDSQYLP